jgi:hypothetical protein
MGRLSGLWFFEGGDAAREKGSDDIYLRYHTIEYRRFEQRYWEFLGKVPSFASNKFQVLCQRAFTEDSLIADSYSLITGTMPISHSP